MNAKFNPIEIETRITQLRVDYAPHDVAYTQLKQRIDMALYHGYKGACAVTGETGEGKTFLTQRVSLDYPRVETAEGSRVPVIYYQLTAKPTFIGIMQGLLTAYGVPFGKRDTEQQLFELLKVQITECGTRVFFIDDAQHFVEEGLRRLHLSNAKACGEDGSVALAATRAMQHEALSNSSENDNLLSIGCQSINCAAFRGTHLLIRASGVAYAALQ